MTVIVSKRHSTRNFSWHKDANQFSAFASDLGRSFETFGRFYDDACDEGFLLVSHVTGVEMPCVIDHTDTDGEGDVRFWILRPVNKNGRIDRNLWSVQVFND